MRFHGYSVFPDIQLPQASEEEYDRSGRKDSLARCELSIHLIGAKYGVVPDGPSEKSVTVLQNELAIERYKKGGLRRIISLPEGTRSESAAQQDFIEKLLTDPALRIGRRLSHGGHRGL